ncbi:NADP oxidoreductase [Thiosulfativibrio zosterae]|uniref:FAD-binding FR-type domain-containing protein n=1 Tax=Thiosulfativibrio zosterae TaxID=2675053 RepID=A0A6F8PKE3_9GAMM|nr:NADP oxidoreductase [Thiosulfativibrio zosterae]BBP42569.1 hypothetical protein THMIRHAT_03150 [Thiosulfativibrio zosterae]
MQLSVVFNHKLTPLSDKSIYHMQLSGDATLTYEPGDWLKITPQNQPGLVKILLEKLNLSVSETLEIRRVGQVTAGQALLNHLEITQLNPAILNKIQRQFDLKIWPDRSAMMADAMGKDILDLLERFDFLLELGVEFLELLSPLAPRYYSIASAPNAQNTLDLLYREVVSCCEKRQRLGVASGGLAQKTAGDLVAAELNTNAAFKLPETLATPIIMVGAGTGLAPFRGFCQARFANPQASENWLFFGETHAKQCFLWQDELQQWQAHRGLQLFCAFSRDQAHKRYVSDLLWEQGSDIWALMQRGANLYMCGSKTGLALGVEQVMLKILQDIAGMDEESAKNLWQSWKTQRRVQLDVY